MRRLAALVLCLLLAGCASGKGAPSPSVASSSIAPSPTSTPTSAPPPTTVAPLRVVDSPPLVVRLATAPASLSPPAGVQDLVFATAADGWLVTTNQVGQAWASGIWSSTDGGATWGEVWSGAGIRLSRIGLRPGAGGLYATGMRGAPVGSPIWLTSPDGGATWSETAPTLPPPAPVRPGDLDIPLWPSLRFDFVTPDVGYAAVDPEDLYQQQTRVLKTADGGRTWGVVPLPAGFFPLGGLDFQDAAHGWITGWAKGACSQLWHTGDGGRSWQPVPGTCAPFSLYAVEFVDARHGFVGGANLPSTGSRAAGILETTDGGAHWRSVDDRNGPTHLAFTSPTQGWAWGGTCKMGQNGPCRGALLVSHDGGRTWNATGRGALLLAAVGGQAWVNDGWPESDGLARSTDGGRTWSTHVQPHAADFGGVSSAPGSRNVWLRTAGGTFVSADQGRTWAAISPNDSPVVRVGGGVLFSTETGDLRVAHDNGGTWTTIRPPGESYGAAAVAFSNAKDGLVLVPTHDCPTTCIAVDRTADGGQTWTAAGTVALEGNGPWLGSSPAVAVIVGSMDLPPPSAPGPTLQIPAFGVSRDGGSRWDIETLPTGADCGSPAAVGPSVWVPCETSPYGGLLLHSADGGRTWTAATSTTVVPQSVAMTDAQHGWMVAATPGSTRAGLFRTTDGCATWSQVWPSLPPTDTPAASAAN